MPDGNAGKLASTSGTPASSDVSGGFNTYGRQLDPEDVDRLMFMIENTKDKAELKSLYQSYLDDKQRLIEKSRVAPQAATGTVEPNFRTRDTVLPLPDRLKPTAEQGNTLAPQMGTYQPDVFDALIQARATPPRVQPAPIQVTDSPIPFSLSSLAK